MRRTVRLRAAGITAAVAVVLAAGGCGTGGAGTSGASSPPVSAGPEDSRPLTKERALAELEGSAAEAGAPAPDPDWAAQSKKAEAGSLGACGVDYKGFGTEGERVEVGTYDAVVGKLRERGWRESGQRTERKSDDGTVGVVQALLKKRDWTLVAEFRGVPGPGTVTLTAFEDACVERVRQQG